MKEIVVLGAGMVGRAIALDMSKRHSVKVVDVNRKNLQKLSDVPALDIVAGDVTNEEMLDSIIVNADLVISAVPGTLGFACLKRIIENGKNVVDIAFFPEDAFKLDALAKEKNVTAVVDCGVAPGMSNLLLGYHHRQMKVQRFCCLVGGLPVERRWPFEYKAPFSPSDVIEEYLRPARFVENGQLVTKAALSDPELVHFKEIGTLEAFNTDGLRTLIKTIDAPNMIEKTLRYPGYIDKIRVFKECGFFNTEPINIGGQNVVPLELSSKLLFDEWMLGDEEPEFTIMHISIEGNANGRPKTVVYNLLDRYDAQTKTSSMARTTGYTCTAVANLVLENSFERKGICPPEYIGEGEKDVKFILNYLSERNVIYRKTEN